MVKLTNFSEVHFNRGPLFQEPPSPPKDEGSTPPPADGGSTTPVNAQPPAGSSLLFGALADSGKIKQRKNGSYRMVLDGVDEINWFTDRPNGVEGTWKPQKLLRKWDKYFSTSKPNSQAGFKADEEQKMVTFEMFKPRMKSGKMIFNINPLSDSGEDKLTGIQDIVLSDVSLFIDDAVATSSCKLINANLEGAVMPEADLTGANLTDSNLTGAILNSVNLTGADLTGAFLEGANLTEAELTNAYLGGAYLKNTILTDAIWKNTTCPDGTMNDGTSPCTAEQLI